MSKFNIYNKDDKTEYFFNLEEITDGIVVTLVDRNGSIQYSLLRIDKDGITCHEGVWDKRLPFKTTTEGTIAINK